jgi:hypothetical protein
MFRKLDGSSAEGKETPEGGNRTSFLILAFFSCLEFRALDKVLKHSDSECYCKMLN